MAAILDMPKNVETSQVASIKNLKEQARKVICAKYCTFYRMCKFMAAFDATVPHYRGENQMQFDAFWHFFAKSRRHIYNKYTLLAMDDALF